MIKRFSHILWFGVILTCSVWAYGFDGNDMPQDDLDLEIGQMVMVGFRGLSVDENSPIVQEIREHRLSGVILYAYDGPAKSQIRNIQSPEQVRMLCETLRGLTPYPLWIAIDQEGGRVCRLKPESGFPPTISAQALGEMNDLQKTGEAARSIADTLAKLKIDVNFAPVVDLNLNPDNPVIGRLERSFSADPDRVTAHALEFIRAHRQRGVLCSLKHFPGHGSSLNDSHLGLTDVTGTWQPMELEPYRRIIDAGECDLIMTAHIFNSQLDPALPATLSRPVITGILREKLHYGGVVISDDLQMKAIADYYGLEKAIQLAIEAGVDVLLFSNNSSVYDEQIGGRAVKIIRRLILDGKIDQERISQSLRRIKKLKQSTSLSVPSPTVD